MVLMDSNAAALMVMNTAMVIISSISEYPVWLFFMGMVFYCSAVVPFRVIGRPKSRICLEPPEAAPMGRAATVTCLVYTTVVAPLVAVRRFLTFQQIGR